MQDCDLHHPRDLNSVAGFQKEANSLHWNPRLIQSDFLVGGFRLCFLGLVDLQSSTLKSNLCRRAGGSPAAFLGAWPGGPFSHIFWSSSLMPQPAAEEEMRWVIDRATCIALA